MTTPRYTLPLSLSPADRNDLEFTLSKNPDHSKHALARAALRLGLALEAKKPGSLSRFLGQRDGEPRVGRPRKITSGEILTPRIVSPDEPEEEKYEAWLKSEGLEGELRVNPFE